MTISISELRKFENNNTCLEILKAWFKVNDLEGVLKELNDPTNAFIPDAAYDADVSEDYAVNTIIKNINKKVNFKIVDEHDFNTGWPLCLMTINKIKYYMDWNIED